MGKLTAPLEETTYSFFKGDDADMRFVADEDDEVVTTVSHRSVWQQVSSKELSVYTQIL